MACTKPAPLLADEAAAVESEYAKWLAVQATVPGLEVHVEPDVTWVVQPGVVWGNCAIRIRFATDTVEQRLDRLLARYRETRRGGAFWVSPFATPADLPARLRARGLRCRKHYPAMYCDLRTLERAEAALAGITIQVVEDHGLFTRHPHPYFGPIRTALRRFELARLAHLSALRPRRVWDFAALREGTLVGGCTLFLDHEVAGFHDVGVLPSARRRGIGAAVMREACAFARERGAAGAVLIASGMGYGMYERVGFREVGRIGYWYRHTAVQISLRSRPQGQLSR